MKIAEFGQLQMTRTNAAHTGATKFENGAENGVAKTSKSFQSYLLEAMDSMNQEQVNVSKLSEQMITDPDSLDIHDVTIAMSKARMSLNLAQSVIDRLVTGWNEISTTR
ncbi:MAG: flagellar hook-basal body complex protein FliE [Treponema sp.]|nr:flagellar hook-basal body complex protein FliE [Treponema sp.]